MNHIGHPRSDQMQLRGWLTLAVLIVAFLVSYLDRHLLALLVAPVKTDLRIDDFQMGLLVGIAFSLFYALFGVPTGRLADRYNRKWLIVAGLLLWTAATISSGLATSFALLFMCRMAVGIGESVLGPASYSMLGDLFPPERLVRATAALSLAATLSAGLAYILGGQVIHFAERAEALPFGLQQLAPWQRSFVLVGLPGFVVAALILFVREPARARDAAAHAGNQRVFDYLWSHRAVYGPIYLCASGMAAMLAGGLTWFPTHLNRVFGMTAVQAGTALGAIQIVGAVAGTMLGVAITEGLMRRGYSDAPLRTIVFTALASAALAIVFAAPSLESTLALWTVAVIAQNTYYGNVIAALQIATPSRARGTNIAMLYLAINVLGLGLGSAITGAMSDHLFAGNPRGIGYGLAFAGGGGALLASWCAWSVLPKYRRLRASLDQQEVAT